MDSLKSPSGSNFGFPLVFQTGAGFPHELTQYPHRLIPIGSSQMSRKIYQQSQGLGSQPE
jgi:hypothetical protein